MSKPLPSGDSLIRVKRSFPHLIPGNSLMSPPCNAEDLVL